jgi:division protein CdvB (Snf7/Vps24/ESCRT-III family)
MKRSLYAQGQNIDLQIRTSYRNLLDTAETIIDMEVRMEQVESKLARVGQSCNSRDLERISKNAVTMDTHSRSRGQSLSTS